MLSSWQEICFHSHRFNSSFADYAIKVSMYFLSPQGHYSCKSIINSIHWKVTNTIKFLFKSICKCPLAERGVGLSVCLLANLGSNFASHGNFIIGYFTLLAFPYTIHDVQLIWHKSVALTFPCLYIPDALLLHRCLHFLFTFSTNCNHFKFRSWD